MHQFFFHEDIFRKGYVKYGRPRVSGELVLTIWSRTCPSLTILVALLSLRHEASGEGSLNERPPRSEARNKVNWGIRDEHVVMDNQQSTASQ